MDPGDAQINEAIAKAWADECGGQLAIELNQERKALSQGVRPPFNREHFEATSHLFKEAGLSEEEHLVYRSTALLDRCEKTLWKLISDINPDWHLDEDERGGLARRQFIEPKIDRRQLEVEATKIHLRELMQKQDATRYDRRQERERMQDVDNRHQEDTEAEQREVAKAIRKGNLPEITIEAIEKAGLTDKEIVDIFFSRNPTEAPIKDKDDWIKELQSAAYRCCQGQQKGELKQPLRIQKRADSTWHWVALTHKGDSGKHKKGEQHQGNRYGIIAEILNQLDSVQ